MTVHEESDLAYSLVDQGRISRRKLIVGSGAAAIMASLAARHSALAQHATPEAGSDAALPVTPPELVDYANDWPAPQGNLANQRANLTAAIDASNVANLEVAWTFPLSTVSAYGATTCTPIIAGNAVYIQDQMSNVYAIDRETGELIWQTLFEVPCFGPNGVAIGYGMIFGATGDSKEAFALDAATGEEVWRFQISGSPREGIDMAPAVYGGMVLLSTVPGNTQAWYSGGARGVLYALDARNGDVLWQFYTVDADLWGEPSVNSGGGAWYPPAIDEAGNSYWDIANPAPFQRTEADGEPVDLGSTFDDALFTNCLVSLEPDGSLRWYYAAKRHDIYDHDLQQSPVLATIENDGNPYTVALASGKLGKVIAVEASTGLMIWQTEVGEHSPWNDAQWIPEGMTVTVSPGAMGGVESPIAYANGIVYVPVLNLPMDFDNKGLVPESIDITTATGQLTALDVVDGTVKWDVMQPAGTLAGATVANNVVFTGALDGLVRAYATEDGSSLWAFDTGVGLNAPFAVAGDLLVVPAGGLKIVAQDYVPEVTPTGASDAGPAIIGFKLPS